MKFLRFFILLAVFSVTVSVSAQYNLVVKEMNPSQISTWGDQGDGTFKNPILNSNYPDSDVEKFEDKWYMISSKGRYMKGMTILESEDLVNWSIIGGIVDSVDWYTDGKVNGEGVWAGDLVRHNNRWFCYFIDIDKGLFVCTSDDIKGPWSKPMLIIDRKGMTDPAVYFDEEKQQGYLICNYQILGTGDERMYYNRLFKLDWNGLEIMDEGRDIYVESGAEAVKIYKVEDYIYLFFSEWTTDAQGRKLDRRQIVLRSKDIAGPYEKKVVLEKDPVTGRSCSQGSLVQVPNGSWWYFHQLIQQENTYEGRPQCLIPVQWENDWPVLGSDPDGNGIGNTIWSSCKPIQGKRIRSPQTDDDFNTKELSPQWLWDGNPINHLWSLTESKGFLRLYGVSPKTVSNIYKTLPNKLLQRKMGKGKDTITTKLHYKGMTDKQSAGLILTGFNTAAAGIEYTAKDGYRFFVQTGNNNKAYLNLNKKGSKSIYIRAMLDARKLKFALSDDGKNFKNLEDVYTMETRGFNGIFIGLFSMNEGKGKGYADFDWFSYKYDGPKVMKLNMPN